MAAVTKTKKDVDSMSAKDRLWDSLDYTYGKRRDESDAQFAKAYSQAENQLLNKGMQRSSYGQQSLAAISNAAADARDSIYGEQIADYQNRLYQIERDEVADQQWQAQFDESQRQYDQNYEYQKSRDTETDRQWQTQFDEEQRKYEKNYAYQEGRDTESDRQWQEEFNESAAQEARRQAETERANKAQEAYNTSALEETIRSNKAGEAYNTAALEETTRSNKATEAYNLAALEETTRSNKENEYIEWAKIDAEYGDHDSGSGSSDYSSSYSSGSGSSNNSNASKTTQDLIDELGEKLAGKSTLTATGINNMVTDTGSVKPATTATAAASITNNAATNVLKKDNKNKNKLTSHGGSET